MKKICIDLTNIVPGKGGAGGGIATYGKELILGVDAILAQNERLRASIQVTALLNTHTFKGLNLQHINTQYFEVNNQSLYARMYWLQVRLPKLLRQERVDVLHRVLSEMPLWKVCKYVVTVHDFMFELYLRNPAYSKYLNSKNRWKFKLLNTLLSKAVQISDLVITNSRTTCKDVRMRFQESEGKTIPITLGYSPSHSSKKSSLASQNDNFLRFGVVAAFHPHKGHLQVIHMAKRLIQLGYSNRFHFYFRGSPVYQEYYQEIKEEILKSDLGAHFTFEQYDSQLSLADIYNRYTATVLLSQYEGFGLPVIESQAFGKPVICSEIPVFQEILGGTAIYLENNPTDQRLEQLVNKLSDPDSIQGLIEQGKENAAKYQWDRTCNNTMQAYLDLLK